MGLAANAIDLIVPPQRSGEPSARDGDGEAFGAHLDAAQPRERPERPERPIQREAPREAQASESEDLDERVVAPEETPAPRAEAAQQPATRQTHAAQAAPTAILILANLAAQRPAVNAAAETIPATPETQPQATATPQQAAQPVVVAAQAAHAKPHAKGAGAAKPASAKATTSTGAVQAQTPTQATTAAAPETQTAQVAPVQQATAEAPKQEGGEPTPSPLLGLAAPAPAQDTPRPEGRDGSIDTEGVRAAVKTPALAPEPKLQAADADASPKLAKVAPSQAQAAPREITASAAPARAEAPAPSLPLTQISAPQRAEAAPDVAIAARAAPVAQQIGREIIRRSHDGATRFEMRLDPAELGRVDIKLEVSRDHRVTAVISADNPQALTELSRGARDLQQALSAAGLDLADDGLSFDLSGQQSAFAQPDSSERQQQSARNHGPAAPLLSEEAPTTPVRALALERWRGARVDLIA